MFTGDTASSPVLTLVVQVVIQMTDHVLDRLITPLRVQGILDRLRRLHQVVHVDPWAITEHPPQKARQVEQEGLKKKHDGNPLVVTQVLLQGTRLTSYGMLWQVVGVWDPAYFVGVFFVVVCEVGWAPAVDGTAHVLGGADDHSESHQEHHRETVVQSIHQVIVVADVDLGDLGHSTDQAVHGEEQKTEVLETVNWDTRQYNNGHNMHWSGITEQRHLEWSAIFSAHLNLRKQISGSGQILWIRGEV